MLDRMTASVTKAILAFCFCFIVLLLAAFYHRQSFLSLHDQFNWDDPEQVGALSELLHRAAIPHSGQKAVIFTGTNAAWAEPGSLLSMFFESFELLKNRTQEDLLKHLIVLAFDQRAYERCVEMHPLCYQVMTKGVDFSSAQPYGSHDYKKMMWRRVEFLNTVLRMGYSFIFSDADIIWFRNPFPYLLGDQDFQIATDRYNGDPNSHDNAPNGGYIFARSNKRTIKFYKFWYESRLNLAPKHEQDVFIEIRHNTTIKDIGVSIGYLDTKFFGSFCSHWVFNMNVSVTMHANCCNGLKNKLRNLQTLLDDWKVHNGNDTMVKRWRGPNGCTFESIP